MKKTIWLTLLLGFCWIMMPSCKKKMPSCGCDAATIDTINSQSGTLSIEQGVAGYQFAILTGPPGLETTHYICNVNFPGFQTLGDSAQNNYVPVLFSGYVKDYCLPPATGYTDLPPEVIVITAISRQ